MGNTSPTDHDLLQKNIDSLNKSSRSNSILKEQSIASDSDKAGSKSKRKGQIKDSEKLVKAIADLESIVKQIEQNLPDNQKRIIDYMQAVNNVNTFI